MTRLCIACLCLLWLVVGARAEEIRILKAPTVFHGAVICEEVDDMVALVAQLRMSPRDAIVPGCHLTSVAVVDPVAAIRAEQITFAYTGECRQIMVLMFRNYRKQRFLFLVRTRVFVEM